MKNTFGESVSITLFGESHGVAIGAILDGLAPGIEVDEEFIAYQMNLRRSVSSLSTARKEADIVHIVSGVKDGLTTGTPITFIIQNGDHHSSDYEKMKTIARPGHADYSAYCKYHGFSDTRGGGHFSGRITAGIVAAGAIAITALNHIGIHIGTHIAKCAGIADKPFENYAEDIATLAEMSFAVLDANAAEEMKNEIAKAKADGDSVGGILETAVIGLPAGVGEPWFDTLESVLSHGIFAIPAVKGVEFGDGFALADMRGSESNDAYRVMGQQIKTETNHNGGILGGISNGNTVAFRLAVKPTPSIASLQKSINIQGEEVDVEIHGRHDPCLVPRIVPVVEAMAALVTADLLLRSRGSRK